MPRYECSLCCFSSKIKSHYERHLNTNKHKKAKIEREKIYPHISTYIHGNPHISTFKKGVKNIEETGVSPENEEKHIVNEKNKITEKPETSILINDNNRKMINDINHRNYKNDTNKNKKNGYIKCEYCHRDYSCKIIKRHLRDNCTFIPESKRNVLIKKYELDKRSKKNRSIIKIEEKNTINNSNNTTNNNTINNNFTNCNNTTNNNNININLNAFGKENIEKITEKQILNILNKAYAGFPLLLKQLHFNVKENRNIYQPNLNKPFIKYYNGNRWQSDKFDSICQRMFTNVSNILEDWLEEHQTKVNERKQEILNNFIDDCNGGKTETSFTEELKMFFMDYSNEIKEQIADKIKKTNLIE